jgi:hypothetical protein
MDDERLRNPPVEGSGVPDYCDVLMTAVHDLSLGQVTRAP